MCGELERQVEMNQEKIKRFLESSKDAKSILRKVLRINGSLLELLKLFYAELPLEKALTIKTKPKFIQLSHLIQGKLEQTQRLLTDINEIINQKIKSGSRSKYEKLFDLVKSVSRAIRYGVQREKSYNI